MARHPSNPLGPGCNRTVPMSPQGHPHLNGSPIFPLMQIKADRLRRTIKVRPL
jgi:hypothetical protein